MVDVNVMAVELAHLVNKVKWFLEQIKEHKLKGGIVARKGFEKRVRKYNGENDVHKLEEFLWSLKELFEDEKDMVGRSEY